MLQQGKAGKMEEAEIMRGKREKAEQCKLTDRGQQR
jgi:hypothetical protein